MVQGTLQRILENEDGRKELLLLQHITWIHKEYDMYDRNHASYIIDVADGEILRNPKTDLDSEKIQAEVPSEERTPTKASLGTKEDIFVNLFRKSAVWN